MWAQSAELEGAAGSAEVGEGQTRTVFPIRVRGKADALEPSREGIGVECEGSKWVYG